jgi:hypothetical protein
MSVHTLTGVVYFCRPHLPMPLQAQMLRLIRQRRRARRLVDMIRVRRTEAAFDRWIEEVRFFRIACTDNQHRRQHNDYISGPSATPLVTLHFLAIVESVSSLDKTEVPWIIPSLHKD